MLLAASQPVRSPATASCRRRGSFPLVPTPSEEDALDLRTDLLEVLKQLNRDEVEDDEVPGLELDELHHLLARGSHPQITREQTQRAVEVLTANGLACELDDTRFAWTRGRLVAKRFTITSAGKAFLLRAIETKGRI